MNAIYLRGCFILAYPVHLVFNAHVYDFFSSFVSYLFSAHGANKA